MDRIRSKFLQSCRLIWGKVKFRVKLEHQKVKALDWGKLVSGLSHI